MIRKRKNKSYYQIIGTYVCGDFDVVIEFLPQEDNGRSIGSVEMFQKLHLSINKEENLYFINNKIPMRLVPHKIHYRSHEHKKEFSYGEFSKSMREFFGKNREFTTLFMTKFNIKEI